MIVLIPSKFINSLINHNKSCKSRSKSLKKNHLHLISKSQKIKKKELRTNFGGLPFDVNHSPLSRTKSIITELKDSKVPSWDLFCFWYLLMTLKVVYSNVDHFCKLSTVGAIMVAADKVSR